MGGDFGEWLVIALVALIVFGPEELPVVARKVGGIVGRTKAWWADWLHGVAQEPKKDEQADER